MFMRIFWLCSMLAMSAAASAAEPVFQTEIDQMVERLRPPPQVWEDVLSSETAPAHDAPRVKVLRQIDGREVWDSVVETDDDQGVRLAIHFRPGSAELEAEAHDLLALLARALSAEGLQNTVVTVDGHTDSDGARDANARLSLARAQAVCRYLTTRLGIDPARLQPRGFGEALPLAPNTSPANQRLNRRVVVQAQPAPK